MTSTEESEPHALVRAENFYSCEGLNGREFLYNSLLLGKERGTDSHCRSNYSRQADRDADNRDSEEVPVVAFSKGKMIKEVKLQKKKNRATYSRMVTQSAPRLKEATKTASSASATKVKRIIPIVVITRVKCPLFAEDRFTRAAERPTKVLSPILVTTM